MHVTVFGATGAIGKLVVPNLLIAGHAVTVYVRTPGKIPESWRCGVDTVVGEMSDAEAIDTAVSGADAVVSALGPSMSRKATGLPLVEGVTNILAAMKRHDVRRYVGNGTPSVLDRRDAKTLQTRMIGLTARTLLPRAHQELLGMSALIMNSGLDWTIVRFIAPRDGAAKGIKHQGFFGTDKIGFTVRRADIAAFTAAQVDTDKYLNAAPAISN
ncbi:MULTISPECIES: NAD(P)-dependent oxidoreductase [Mycolicibacter]|uniref:NAD(P)H-binding protein n=1 Tax=Mycolicibacter kumamotonensis TaxID=354243 RepID=A0A7K3L919_9MYCO|nr:MULTISPECIES: NAD(P)H-binding protein [Mycolicibacter]NDJ88136.1 NAD(P)H-binding protein [Mycolicibacter kumamotonensis]RAV03853.1 NmrA family transcriptional regulator [Mycolicibacter senuensis]